MCRTHRIVHICWTRRTDEARGAELAADYIWTMADACLRALPVCSLFSEVARNVSGNTFQVFIYHLFSHQKSTMQAQRCASTPTKNIQTYIVLVLGV